jgi:hypothetical protein
MRLSLAGLVCEAAGAINEDAAGFLDEPDDIKAAWVIDGVTGINAAPVLPGASDAQWFVSRIDFHLRDLLRQPLPLSTVLSALVDRLIEDQSEALVKAALSDDFDLPAACLIVLHRDNDGWRAARIGDSSMLVREASGELVEHSDFALQGLDRELRIKAAEGRKAGASLADIVAACRPLIRQSRQTRNTPGGYGILEANRACHDYIEYFALERPVSALLCTDGFFRLADLYRAHGSADLLDHAVRSGGIEKLYRELRRIEAEDADCLAHPRLKPADDASAVALGAWSEIGPD